MTSTSIHIIANQSSYHDNKSTLQCFTPVFCPQLISIIAYPVNSDLHTWERSLRCYQLCQELVFFKIFKSWQVCDWLAKWMIMLRFMDLRWPRVFRRSNVGLVKIVIPKAKQIPSLIRFSYWIDPVVFQSHFFHFLWIDSFIHRKMWQLIKSPGVT